MGNYIKPLESEFLKFCDKQEYDFLAFSTSPRPEMVKAYIQTSNFRHSDFVKYEFLGGQRYLVQWVKK
jgi:hypothetical protein